ncbi:hypothetical protein QBC34DRAFT_443317 [Podospora aff. communis PSN243]|uniref:Uncharacterized protein n=1 Tax=Podospora aff. communis PSN243 TaxID=3040156 RepID=A0AAV9G5X7_9PEZI|nr:hypothetical protein QBC34DRAFT_443317 [Podospora aff. communis PSN243]
MGQSSSTPLHLPPNFLTSTLPRTYTVALKKSWTKLTAILTDPHSGFSFAADWPEGYWSKLILYNGPTKEYAPLATAKPTGTMRKDFAITLPSISPHEPERTEIFRHGSSFSFKETYWFGFQVGYNAEKFEWRRSSGEEVWDAPGGGRFGWKLVRIGNGAGGEGYGITSDGMEVVAVWADYGLMSFSKIGTFEFRGSGATGELGNMWSVMAIMSCLCVWQDQVRTVTAAAA